MGQAFFSSARERADYNRKREAENLSREEERLARIADGRKELAAKIVMATIDKIVNEIIRPGPISEERECYEMAGELRSLTPELEDLVKQIIDVNNGVT
jgi:hypothetical protein